MGSALLFVHGEQPLRADARAALETAGYAVAEAADLGAAWREIEARPPDVILLPWSGAKMLRNALAELRGGGVREPARVVVWAPRVEINEAISALEFGADDCISAPFECVELVARVNACLRRAPAQLRPDQLTAGPVVLDKAVHCMTVRDQPVELAPTEFRLMAFLLENQGRVFSREELLRRAWSKNIKAGHRTVDVHVRRLRQLLEPFGCHDLIQTVRGFGYRFVPPIHEKASGRPSAARLTRRFGGF